MAYSTLSDIKGLVPEETLIQLTDDDGVGSVNQGTVTDAIEYADQLIDGYMRGRYTLPLADLPKLVTKVSVDLAVFYLYGRRLDLEMPDSITAKYKNAVKILESIQKGALSLGSDAASEPAGGACRTNKTADDRVFSQEVLDGF